MKIVYDNIIFSLQSVGGISAVWAGLISNIDSQYVLNYIEWKNDNLYRSKLHLCDEKIIIRSLYKKNISKFVNVKFSHQDRFIFHSSIYRICKNKNAINILTVHDFIDLKFNSNLFTRSIKWHLMKRSLLKADAIVCVSNNTKKDLLDFLPQIETNKIFVVHNGKSDDFFKLNNVIEPRNEKFIMFIGHRKGYKNFNVLIDALEINSKFNLIIIGGGPLDVQEIQQLDGIGKDRYTHLSNVDNEVLNKLYNEAFCLVYPSAYEGFGIPVIEAQSSGCPVIAFNNSSLVEVIGNSGILLDNINHNELSNALNMLEDISIRNNYIKLGIENAKRFSWKKMASDYFDIYKKLINN